MTESNRRHPTPYSSRSLADDDLIAPRWHPKRSACVMAVVTLAFVGLIARAGWVQIVEHEFHVAQGEKRHRQMLALEAKRGPIVDRHGALLAVSLTTYEIWAEPKRIDPAAVEPLAKALALSPTQLRERLDSARTHALLKRHVDSQTATRIADLGVAGITQVASSERFYPEGESAAHVVGLTDVDDVGQEGVELAANELLTGEPGEREVIRDRLGRVVSDLRPLVPAHPGQTVRLTIDRRIQQLAFAQLKAALERHRAQAGSVVVLDARTGEILALANAPSFDPNARAGLTPNTMRNRAVVDTFEPGSTIKPLAIATALDAGKVHPGTLVDTAPGRYRIGPNTIHDTSNHGTVSVAQALATSSNIALAKIALTLPAETLWRAYRQYGIGLAPPLPFPGAAAGKLRPWERWRPVEQATMGYGYGLSTSLLQMAQAYTALAGDGTLRPVALIAQEENAAPASTSATGAARATTESSAAALRTMLEAATLAGGTGRAAHVEGYRVGGKTGTAWKHAGTGYAKNRYRSLFVGIAPIDAPRLIVAVMIDDPTSRSYYGGAVAGPVFSAVAGGALQLLGVPPSAPAPDA
ncbi:peptidoglycan D,D-transpeptidase FtsI family protein [Trinickia dinghuensis]|uniref:Peptidoglycan D,D-transpeptidase FtsI n=1 Tax=Trinickia dinghuensis TaxID=2291023 RepID=A0A3D8JW20_9BURK|nr:penicillin-binding protein 2 [Trinickia dinghuensis]RDU96804.1 penicillin-binding protein 2 [Trinickia dinghuensis]